MKRLLLTFFSLHQLVCSAQNELKIGEFKIGMGVEEFSQDREIKKISGIGDFANYILSNQKNDKEVIEFLADTINPDNSLNSLGLCDVKLFYFSSYKLSTDVNIEGVYLFFWKNKLIFMTFNENPKFENLLDIRFGKGVVESVVSKTKFENVEFKYRETKKKWLIPQHPEVECNLVEIGEVEGFDNINSKKFGIGYFQKIKELEVQAQEKNKKIIENREKKLAVQIFE